MLPIRARGCRGQVVLTDVHAGGARQAREVGTVVHDDRRAVAVRQLATTSSHSARNRSEGSDFALIWISGRRRRGRHARASGRLPAGPSRNVGVEDGVERRETCGQAVSASLPSLGWRHESVHEGRAQPAGMEIGVVQDLQMQRHRRRMPSMTVMSSVRLMRAIASWRSRPCVMILAIIES